MKREDDDALTPMEHWLHQPWLAFEHLPPSRNSGLGRIGLRRRGDSPDEHTRNPYADAGALMVLGVPEAIELLRTLLDALGHDGVLEALHARPELCAILRTSLDRVCPPETKT